MTPDSIALDFVYFPFAVKSTMMDSGQGAHMYKTVQQDNHSRNLALHKKRHNTPIAGHWSMVKMDRFQILFGLLIDFGKIIV